GARHRSGEPAWFGHDRRGDVSCLRRGLHAVVRHRALRGHRRLPGQAWPADDPDEERPDHPDRFLRTEQAPRKGGVHLAGPAGRTPG
ncbi:unnamed protein product, partial [Ectocarpus fasciculatus]